MIRVKHLLDDAETCDGQRIWIEPIGLCKDMRQWCHVDHVLSHLGPKLATWEEWERHPDAYDKFRASYRQQLRTSPYRAALQALACAGRREDFTLIHQSDDPQHNSAAALGEYLAEL